MLEIMKVIPIPLLKKILRKEVVVLAVLNKVQQSSTKLRWGFKKIRMTLTMGSAVFKDPNLIMEEVWITI